MSLDESPPLIRFPDDSGRSLAEVIATSPRGATIELAPGRYEGPLTLSQPVVLRGAGDLTRIGVVGGGPVVLIDSPDEAWVEIESVLLEGGVAEHGAGIGVRQGRARLHNVHVRHCRATLGGGAVAVEGGELGATKLRAHDVQAAEGGAVWVGQDASLRLTDSQIEDAEGQRGGAVCLQNHAVATLEGVTIRKARATTSSGGQAFFVTGTPRLSLLRVRLEDAPLGLPLVVDGGEVPSVEVTECDVPRILLDTPGVVDGGGNHWR